MKRRFITVWYCLLIFTVNVSASDKPESINESIFQDTVPEPADSVSEESQACQKKFFWKSYIRFRHEFWNNQEDLNDDLDDLYSFFRLKLYFGAGYRPTKNTEFFVKLVNESRYYGHKGTGDTIRSDHLYRPERHYFEIVFDELYFKWNNIGKSPLSMIIGRQLLHEHGFGNQWLIGDGTPLDGSKTFYYNALRLNYEFNNYTTLDLVALVSFDDDPIVLVSEIERSVTNITNEAGGWLWFKHQFNTWFLYRAFYLYKHETGGGGFQREEQSNIHTLGFHVIPEKDHFWMNAQFAVQAGNYGVSSRSGFGTIIYGGYKYSDDKKTFKVGPWYMFLTGDNPNTENFEAFNNLYGGYPNIDELYLNTWMRESGLSMWTNINLYGAYLEYQPAPKYRLQFWYHLMQTHQPANGDFFGTGKLRGHMIILKAAGAFGKRLKVYYMFEYLWAGDFYFSGADNAILSRINLEWYF